MALRSWVAMVAAVLFSQRSSCSFVCNTSSRAGRAQCPRLEGKPPATPGPPEQPPQPSFYFVEPPLESWYLLICRISSRPNSTVQCLRLQRTHLELKFMSE